MSDRVLRPFANLLNPGRLQVPTGRLRIDRTHQLAVGLQACFIPGVTLKELTGQSAPQIGLTSLTKEGAGLLDGIIGTPPFAAPAQRNITPGAVEGWSAYWRGYQYAAPPAFASLIVCSYDNIGSAPYATWGIISDASGSVWESGGNGYHIAENAQFANPGNGFYSVTARNGGSGSGPGNISSIFLNGILQDTGTGSASVTTTTAQISFGTTNFITNAAYMWNRQLSDEEVAWLERDPYGFLVPADFETPLHRFGTPTVIRPDADSVDGSWTRETGSQTDLYDSINETTASDADYIKSQGNPQVDTVKISLSNPGSVDATAPMTFRYRFQKRGDLIDYPSFEIALLQGSTVIARKRHDNVQEGFTDGQFDLTAAQRAAISDYNDLYFQTIAGAWWLEGAAIDLDFQNGKYFDSTQSYPLSSANLLIHGDGTDGATTFTDATGRHAISRVGDTQIDTAQSKFGGSSILFDGNDLLVADVAFDDFTLSGDFTYDFWFRPAVLPMDSSIAWLTASFGGNHPSIFIRNALLSVYNGTEIINGGTTLSINTWYHLALTRSGTSVRLFLNAVQEGSTATDSTTYTPSTYILFGCNWALTAGFQGHMEEIRALKGTAAWTANFTLPTAPYSFTGPYSNLSISRASIGYAKTAAGTLTQFASGELRITDLGLLVEDARTNSLLRSQEFNSWTKTGSPPTVSSDVTTAPDGTTTADKIISGVPNDEQAIRQTTLLGNGTYAYSCYFKAAEYSRAVLAVSDGDTGSMAGFYDLSAVTAGIYTDAVLPIGNWTGVSYSIEALANGWYRCSMVGTSNAGTPTIIPVIYLHNGSRHIFVGDGSSGLYAWGAQIEAGPFSSSYIPTTTTTATRAAEVITAIGNLDSIVSVLPQSICIGVQLAAGVSGGFTRMITDSTGNKSPIAKSNNNSTLDSYDGGSDLFATLGYGLGFTDGIKAASSMDSNGRSIVGAGGSVANSTSQWTPGTTRLGYAGSSQDYMHGTFRRLTAWNSRLEQNTLRNLTAP